VMIAALPSMWRTRASVLDPYAPEVAKAFREAAAELERELIDRAEESVTLAQAAELGGYSIDHLQRLVSTGQLENVGRKHRPRVRRSAVPLKPGHRLPSDTEATQFSTRRRIVDSVLTGEST